MLGVVQGLTEFAPVSSSGHLIVVPWLLGWDPFGGDPDLKKSFDVALHIGTFLGGLAYFWPDILRYVRAWFRSLARRRAVEVEERLAWLLVVGSIPAAIVGAAAEDVIEEELGAVWLIAVMLVAFGVVLWAVDRRAASGRVMVDLRLRDALIIGVAQALALQPGVSRSGVTITAARALALDRTSAARFSFLLSLPIIAGAGAYKGVDVAATGLPAGAGGAFLWGMVASALSGFLVIWSLLAYLRRRDFAPFVLYRLALAGLIVALIVAGVRSASGA